MTAPTPTVCATCNGEGFTPGPRGWRFPCPGCRCVYCGQPSAMPPECVGGCDVREDEAQRRRADR